MKKIKSKEKTDYQRGFDKGFSMGVYEALQIVKKGTIVSVDESPFIVKVIRTAEEWLAARIRKELLG